MKENMSIKSDLIEGISEVIRDVIDTEDEGYPLEAVPKGNYVRSTNWDILGIITDGFYNEINGQKIIIYTVLYIPNTKLGSYYKNLLRGPAEMQEDMFMHNELEFDLTYYTMLPPVNMEELEIVSSDGGML